MATDSRVLLAVSQAASAPAGAAAALSMRAARALTVGVVGVGQMGGGIAQVAAAAGHDVLLCDARPGAAAAAIEAAERRLMRAAGKAEDAQAAEQAAREALGRMTEAQGGISGLVSADIVIEAVAEDEALKRDLFGQVCMGGRGAPNRVRDAGSHATDALNHLPLAAVCGVPPRRHPSVQHVVHQHYAHRRGRQRA